MKRINITITPQQHERLKAVSKRTGISVSELIRRLVDREYDEKKRRKRQ